MSCRRLKATISTQPARFSAALRPGSSQLSATLFCNPRQISATISQHQPLLDVTMAPNLKRYEPKFYVGRPGPQGPPGPAGDWERERLTGVQDGINKAFSFTGPAQSESERVTINGVPQDSPTHYIIDGNQITFDEPPKDWWRLEIEYRRTQ